MEREIDMRFSKRKWGYYITLIDRKHFKVKILRFHTQKKCSFQEHKKRSELWLFLSGNGSFTKDQVSYLIGKGEYAYVMRNTKHTYKAYKSTYVLEIQFGTYCKEEDIIRYD